MSGSPFLSGEKERLPFAQYVAAALVEIARHMDTGLTSQPDELAGYLQGHFEVVIDAQEIADALEILKECDVAYIAQDPVAGTFVRISDDKFSAFLERVQVDISRYYKTANEAGMDNLLLSLAEEIPTPSWDLLRKNSVLQKYSEFGSPFIEAAMQRVGQKDLNSRLTLGSDRLVSFSDNLPVVEEIRAGLDQLEKELRTNNEVGVALGDAREEAIAEVKALQITMSANQSRAGYLLDVSRRVLGWIGRLVAKTSAEEIVKHLTKLFIGWLN